MYNMTSCKNRLSLMGIFSFLSQKKKGLDKTTSHEKVYINDKYTCTSNIVLLGSTFDEVE